MNLADFFPLLRWIHIAASFMFVAGHGVSMLVAFRLRRETDTARLRALLDLSSWSLGVTGIGLLVLLVSGIVAGVAADYWGQGWIWASLVLLIVIAGVMTPVGAIYYNRVRLALGMRTREIKPGQPDPQPASPEEVAALLRSRRPEVLLLLGGGGFLVILWLMSFRPF